MGNRIEAKGTVVRDPELKTTGSGKVFARLRIAADEVAQGGIPMDAAENKWHTAVFWGDEAEQVVDTVRRGSVVFVTGDHVVREYDDDNGSGVASEIHKPTIEVLGQGKAAAVECRIEAVGNVVRDPELKTTGSEKVLTRVTIAADEVKKDGVAVDAGENKWQTAVFWGEQAKEQAGRFKKGMRVRMTGDLVSREYEDEDGEKRTSREIQRAKIELIERGKGAGRGEQKAA